jgi:hypothetical protein
VTTGEGVTVKLQLPPTATVLIVKREVESELGIRPREAVVFSGNKGHTEKLQDEVTPDMVVRSQLAKYEGNRRRQSHVPQLVLDGTFVGIPGAPPPSPVRNSSSPICMY